MKNDLKVFMYLIIDIVSSLFRFRSLRKLVHVLPVRSFDSNNTEFLFMMLFEGCSQIYSAELLSF